MEINNGKIIINDIEIELTQEQIEKLNPKKDLKPKYGDRYWYINTIGGIVEGIWFNEECDNRRFNFGNVFKTKKDAENYIRFRKTEHKIKEWRDINDNCYRFTVYKDNYYLKFNYHIDAAIWVRDVSIKKTNTMYFSSREKINECINHFDKKDLKFYLTYER